jgi:hypothetical protein
MFHVAAPEENQARLEFRFVGDECHAWLDRLDARAHKNIVIVAMANKIARIAWAVLSSGNEYRPAAVPAYRVRKRSLRPGSATRSHLPAPRRRTSSPPKSAQGQQGRKNSHSGVSTPWFGQWASTSDRLIRMDTRATHHGQEKRSPHKGRIHLRRLVFSTKLTPCSRAADHTYR